MPVLEIRAPNSCFACLCLQGIFPHLIWSEHQFAPMPVPEGPGAISRPHQGLAWPIWGQRWGLLNTGEEAHPLPLSLLLAQGSSHELSDSKETIISSMVVSFSRSRHSSEFMPVTRRIRSQPCRYMLVFFNLPVYSRGVQECGLEGINALQQSLSLGCAPAAGLAV